jgi:hypothetical protein
MSGIQMALMGAGGSAPVTISITDQNISDVDATAAYAYYFLTAGGLVQSSTQSGGSSPTTLETWCTPTSAAANYEVFIDVTSGALSGGSGSGSWLALSSTRNWYVDNTVSGTFNECIFTVEIRQIGTTTVLDSATITLYAEVF